MRIVDSNKNILLVDSEASYTTVGLIENGRLSELYSESADERQTSGNIYKGKVTNVVDGLRSAFVDIGLYRTGFWYIDEALDHKSVGRKGSSQQNNGKRRRLCHGAGGEGGY